MNLPKPNFKKYAKIGALSILGLGGVTVAFDGVVITGPDEVNMVLTAGSPTRFAPEGLSLKIPFYQTTFGATTSFQEYTVPQSSVGLQNGTVTAEDMKSSIFLQFNGTREEREETLTVMRSRMPDYEARITSLAEGALRDVVRLTIIASEDEDETQTVTSQIRSGALNFLDSERVGDRIAAKVQASIDAVIPGTVMVGDREVPRLEIAEYRIGNYEFDDDYLSRRKTIADSRAKAEAARYEQSEKERRADAAEAEADGVRRAKIQEATGEAESIRLRAEQEIARLRGLVEAAGGPEALREQTLAERWNGQSPQVIGGEGVIVDGRFAPGADVIAPLAAKPATPSR